MTKGDVLAAAVCLALVVATLPSCNGGKEESGTQILRSGDILLSVDAKKMEITLSRNDDVLLRFPADGLQLGKVDEIEDRFNYDPYLLKLEEVLFFTPPAGLAWLKPVKMELLEQKTLAVSITFDEGKRASLQISLTESGGFRASLVPEQDGPLIAYFRLCPRGSSDEAFYGLGAYLDDVNHRGKIRAMQMEPDLEMEGDTNEAHIPIPFIIGTRGWGLFVENTYLGVFDVATQEDDLIEVTFGTGAASKDGIIFHLFAAGHPLDVTKHYYEVTGYPLLPARWALGPWIWRDESEDQAQVESDLNTIRDLDLATTAYWIDRPYAAGVNSFDFEPQKFPEPQRMIDLAHELGFRMALWHTPYLEPNNEGTKELLEYAEEHGFFPPTTGLVANSWSKPIDFTNPEAYEWWQGLIRRYTDMGIEGFKLDYAEDVFPSLFGKRNAWKFHDGSDERTMHRGYKILYHRVYAGTLPQDGGFLLCRASAYGDQVNASVIWPGDLDANFWLHGEKVTWEDDSSTKAAGGLPASMVYGLTLGPSGFPFYGSDTGGYRHSPPDKETFTRWFEQTALSSVMQVGTSTNNVAWEFSEETGFDEEMLDWYRTYVRLHLRLFPYEWTYAVNIRKDGRPIQRPLGLAHPELGSHPWDTYLFGDYLLVAPVLKKGARERDVLLPAGRWMDWWNRELYEGNQTISIDAPLEKLPVFLKEGGIVPMLRPTIDAISPTTQPERVDSYAATPGILYPRIFAGGEATTFVLFDGAEVSQQKTESGISLSYKDGKEFKYGALFEVVAAGNKPPRVTDNGDSLEEAPSLEDLEARKSGWAYDQALGGTVFVKVESGEHSVEVKF